MTSAEFLVMSRAAAKAHTGDLRPWAAIQIHTGTDWPDLDETGRRGCLRLNFADLEYAGDHDKDWCRAHNTALFSFRHAKRILDFVAEHAKHVEYFLIHCEAGMSRSPAVAAAVQNLMGRDGWERRSGWNRRVYQRIIRVGMRHPLYFHGLLRKREAAHE